MSDYEMKEKSFSMFKIAQEKKKSEKSPDFNGEGKLSAEDIDYLKENGGIIRLSAWTKLPKGGGAPYISGFIEAKRERGESAPPEAVDDFLMTPAIQQATSNIQDIAPMIEDTPF